MNFVHLTTEAEIRELIEFHNENSEFVVWDTETTDKDPRKAKLVDIQMSGYEEDEAVMFSGEFLPLMRGLNCTLVGWNLKYDFKVACLHGVDLRDKLWRDGMLIHHVVDENAPHDLDSLVQEVFKDDYKEKFWALYENYQDASLEERLSYACKDIIYTGRVYKRLVERVRHDLVAHVHRLAAALLDTEIEGIPVDLQFTIETGAALQEGIQKLERELREAGGFHCEAVELEQWSKEIEKAWTPKGKKWTTIPKPEFNFASSDQVAKLLYDELKLPVQLNPKKKRTADDKALEELEHLHPLVPMIRNHRKMTKMYGSFIEGVLDRAEGATIYPSFNVNGTKTGRISHSDPNMGQMPSKGEWSKIRGIFVPRPGHVLITADYGQLEVCIAAHYSQDKNLLKIIHEGASKHDITARELGIERGLAKTLNFGMQYLCSPRKVKQLLGCSDREALAVWQKYWRTYEGEQRVINECIAKIEAGQPIVNPFGRERHFPGYVRPRWADPTIGNYDKPMRQAYNALTQGTGGDMMSRAFYLTTEELKARQWGRGWFTVHDEGLIEVKKAHAEEAEQLLVANMLSIGPEIGLTVPLKVESSGALDRWQK